MELLVPADAEKAALEELSIVLPEHGFPDVTTAAKTLGTKIAAGKPTEFGRVLATGGPGRDMVTDSPTLILEGYATKEQRARDLCALMLAGIQRAARTGTLGSLTIYSARVVSLPANLPHPNVPTHFRFTATISVDLRRAAI